MFYKFEKATFLFFKKKFREISYISYTDTTKFLYLLAISGVGLGVGFPTRCRIILHLPSFFLLLFAVFPHRKRAGIVQFRAKYLGKMQGYRQKNGIKTSRILHPSYILHHILHPTLHPKSPGFIRGFHAGCRKCRRFSKNFFCGRACGGFGSSETSDFFGQKYGGFATKVRRFYAKKSDVFRMGRKCSRQQGQRFR